MRVLACKRCRRWVAPASPQLQLCRIKSIDIKEVIVPQPVKVIVDLPSDHETRPSDVSIKELLLLMRESRAPELLMGVQMGLGPGSV